jgi:hypothetical protein
MRSAALLVVLALPGCAESGARDPSHPAREDAGRDAAATVTRPRGATGPWSSLEPQAHTPVSAVVDASDAPSLPWAQAPAGVSCIIRGKTAPFPPPCDHLAVDVTSASGAPLAAFDAAEVDVVWGIRRRGSAPWIHARSESFTLTGFTKLDAVSFRVTRGTPLVANHVWALPDIPVELVGATPDGALQVRIVDDVAGLEELVSEIPCDAVAFDPPEPVFGLPVTAPPAPMNEADQVFPRNDRLTLRASPGGAPLVTLSYDERTSLWLDLRVVERKAGATRLFFETQYARFDVWVDDAELSAVPSAGGHGGGVGCGTSGGRQVGSLRPPVGVARELSAIRVGEGPADAVPALRVAAGVAFFLGETRGDFVEVQEIEPFRPLGANRFWIARSALEESSQ